MKSLKLILSFKKSLLVNTNNSHVRDLTLIPYFNLRLITISISPKLQSIYIHIYVVNKSIFTFSYLFKLLFLILPFKTKTNCAFTYKIHYIHCIMLYIYICYYFLAFVLLFYISNHSERTSPTSKTVLYIRKNH